MERPCDYGNDRFENQAGFLAFNLLNVTIWRLIFDWQGITLVPCEQTTLLTQSPSPFLWRSPFAHNDHWFVCKHFIGFLKPWQL